MREFEDVYDHLGRLMSAALGETAMSAMAELPWSPLGDISETEDSYIIDIDLPGVAKDQINVELNERELSVTGEMTEKERGRRHHRTRHTGRFEYRVILPGEVDTQGVSAQLDDGVLMITAPKAAAAKPRHVEISSG
ncbi:Hsp20/alpha crystallin family protein [Sinosporangium album]|nr:Hsp20/alpha crystallin family protein [Sinosporangium album]